MSVGGFLSAPDARAEAPLALPATADGHVKTFPCIVSGFTRISGRNGPRLALQHGKRALDPPRRERPGGVAPLRFASRDDVDRKRLDPAGGSLWPVCSSSSPARNRHARLVPQACLRQRDRGRDPRPPCGGASAVPTP